MQTVHTYRYGNAEIVVHRPNLSHEEKAKREAALLLALIAYGKETVKKTVKNNDEIFQERPAFADRLRGDHFPDDDGAASVGASPKRGSRCRSAANNIGYRDTIAADD